MSPQVIKQRNRYFGLGAFLGLLILLVSVGAVGVLTYDKLASIIDTAASASNPENDRLLGVREIVSDLYDAENHAINFGLNRDEAELQAFELAQQNSAKHLAMLSSLSNYDMTSVELQKQLGFLIRDKFAVMRAQIELRSHDRTDEVLTQLSLSLQKTLKTNPVKPAAKSETQPPKSKDKPLTETETAQPSPAMASSQPLTPEAKNVRVDAVYRFLMGAPLGNPTSTKRAADAALNAPAETAAAAAATALPANKPASAPSLPDKIEHQLQALTQAESDRYRERLERDLALTARSQELSASIRRTVGQIDEIEHRLTVQKSNEVAATARTANALIVIFCIVFPILLLLIAVAIVSVFRAMQRQEASILEAKLQADALANARARFLATMSHEIRTPMNAIIGFSNQLLKTPLQGGQREHLALVQRAADHLLGIVNTVLDFSRLEAGQMQYGSEAFDLQSEIDLVLDLLRPQFEAKGVALKRSGKLDDYRYLRGDALRLRQILLNLLGNALKFTEKGSVTLTVNLADERNGRRQVRFSVSDSGIGIPAQRLKAVFRAFEQSDASISTRFGGSGLGLAITKMLVEQQGGTIDIVSEVGVGTTIWFAMPFEPGTVLQPEMVAPIEPQGKDLQGRRALIVDDEPFNRRLLKEILHGWGMDCVEVNNGHSAAMISQSYTFDVILMDLRMPEMNGIQATHAIRKAGLNLRTPILMLTAAIDPHEVEACVSAGADGVLGKPLAEHELHRRLVALLGSSPAAAVQQPVVSPAPPAEHFSLRNLERMAGTNKAFLQEMVLSFVNTARKAQTEIREAMATEDWLTIREVAHRLAAPAKHIEAAALYDVLKAMESTAASGYSPKIAPLVAEMDHELDHLLPSLQLRIAS